MMKITLMVPDSPARRAHGIRPRSRLTWTTDHAAARRGRGVLLFSNGDLLDRSKFRSLRDDLGAWIETSDPSRVQQALGVPPHEAGIFMVTPEQSSLLSGRRRKTCCCDVQE